MTRIRRVAAAGIFALALAAPAVAGAATVSYEGDTLVFRAAPGEANFGTVGLNGAGQVQLSDTQPPTSADARCAWNEPQGHLECARPARVRLELGDGQDVYGFTSDYPADLPAEVYAGDGDDRINGYGGYGAAVPHLIDGGAGFDTLDDYVTPGGSSNPPITLSYDGVANDGRPGEADNVAGIEKFESHVNGTFTGGPGDDEIFAWANIGEGDSRITGGAGNDKLRGHDHTETIDGGPGNDRVEGGMGNDTLTGGRGRTRSSATPPATSAASTTAGSRSGTT